MVKPISRSPFDAPVIFIHIPKTGGMTFLSFLENVLGQQDNIRFKENGWKYLPGDWPLSLLTRKRLISGHIPYSNIKGEIPGASYVTLLRHPVNQVISHYWQIRRHIDQKGVDASRSLQLIEFEKEMTLDDVVRQKENGIPTYIDNIQTRFLGWEGPCTNAKDLSPDLWLSTLERAKNRLIHEFSFFGICEMMMATKKLFCATFSLPYVESENVHINTRPQYQRHREVDESLTAQISGQNAYDVELYDFARNIFDNRCKGGDRR